MAKDDARYVRGKAVARVSDGPLVFRREIEAAAGRIAEELASRAGESPELGIWDDVTDVIDAVGEAAKEIINHLAGATEELTELTEIITEHTWLTTLTALLFESDVLEGQVEGATKPKQASAKELLAARQALLEARDRQRNEIKELLETVRAQIRGQTEK